MKIGDEVYIHGYIDEIRSDVVIIRNEGGYFGTVPSEINCSEKPNNCETCRHYTLACDLFSEICRYEPKTEPQTEIRKDVPVICAECDHVSIHQKYLFCELSHRTVYNAKPEWCPLPKLFIADDEPKDEPQTDNGIGCSRCGNRYVCFDRHTPNAVHCNNYGKITDEPQTERSE